MLSCIEMTRTRQSTTREELSQETSRPAAGPSPPVTATDGTDGIAELAEAIRTLRTVDEVRAFLRDLCTRAELEALAHRWQTARLVDQGVPYVEIAERVPTSTATVTRVAQWVRHGAGGYRIALDRGKRR
jgi:TrpR-related protein YerC/YecD